MENNREMTMQKWISIAVAVVVMLISILACGRHFSSPDAYGKSIQYLDSKKTTVLELAGATTAASVGISAIPGDAATPIANKLADLSTWFMLIVCALFLEKYLVTIAGFATFYILIPAACILYILYVLINRDGCRKAASKILAFGLAIFFLVPASVFVSNKIESTYQSSIDTTLTAAQQTLDEINSKDNATETDTDVDGNWLTGFIDKVENKADSVKESINSIPEKLKTMVNNFIEAAAVLLVTSCLIPILVLLAFIWFIKLFIGLDTPLALPAVNSPRQFFKRKREDIDD